jgi:hypothetical protein
MFQSRAPKTTGMRLERSSPEAFTNSFLTIPASSRTTDKPEIGRVRSLFVC